MWEASSSLSETDLYFLRILEVRRISCSTSFNVFERIFYNSIYSLYKLAKSVFPSTINLLFTSTFSFKSLIKSIDPYTTDSSKSTIPSPSPLTKVALPNDSLIGSGGGVGVSFTSSSYFRRASLFYSKSLPLRRSPLSVPAIIVLPSFPVSRSISTWFCSFLSLMFS